jgi:hypothetical protein
LLATAVDGIIAIEARNGDPGAVFVVRLPLNAIRMEKA